MRVITRVMVVLCATGLFGCVLTGSTPVVPPTHSPGATATAAYWNHLREITMTQSKSDDMVVLADIIRKQADSIRKLPSEGVDDELVQSAEAVAACHEKLLGVVDQAAYSVAGLKASPELRKQFMEAGRQTGEAQARLKALRPKLSARYMTDYPHLDK